MSQRTWPRGPVAPIRPPTYSLKTYFQRSASIQPRKIFHTFCGMPGGISTTNNQNHISLSVFIPFATRSHFDRVRTLFSWFFTHFLVCRFFVELAAGEVLHPTKLFMLRGTRSGQNSCTSKSRDRENTRMKFCSSFSAVPEADVCY